MGIKYMKFCVPCGFEHIMQSQDGQRVYGTCEVCGYLLTAENSSYSVEKTDNCEYAAKMLLKAHYEASPKCSPDWLLIIGVCRKCRTFNAEVENWIDTTPDSLLPSEMRAIELECDKARDEWDVWWGLCPKCQIKSIKKTISDLEWQMTTTTEEKEYNEAQEELKLLKEKLKKMEKE